VSYSGPVRQHVYFKCDPCKQGGWHCQFCDGGLLYCVVCKCGEAELGAYCPGPAPTREEIAEILDPLLKNPPF
jgi:hypothetical protein